MDRRQRKTRTVILNTCIALIQEKDFQKITINEIAQRADINRGTFYLHFVDKYDMLDSFENEMIEKIEEVIVNNLPKERSDQLFIQSRYDTIVQILTCYEENKELLQFLLKSSYSSFQTKLRNKLKLVFTNLIFPILGELEYEIPTDLFTIAFTSISLSLAEYAYQSETPINIEKSANLLFNIVLEGPAKTLGLIKDGDK
jgi:AcrR family transcriptional regulator